MDFSLTEEQIAIQEGVRKTLEPFTDDYWLEHDRTGIQRFFCSSVP